MNKRFGFVSLILVLVIAVGIMAWKVLLSDTDVANTPKTARVTNQANDASDTDPSAGWQRITSSQNGFSLRVPDGWVITTYNGDDQIRSNDIDYIKGKPAVIEEAAYPYSGDASIRFGLYKTIQIDSNLNAEYSWDQTNFSIGNLRGTKYTRVISSDWEGCCTYPNTEEFIYEFKKGESIIYVTYNIYKYNGTRNQFSDSMTHDDDNQTALIEKVISTLEIN